MTRAANHVAVVDDEASVRKALARLLTAASFRSASYSSVRQFIDSLRDEAPDCLVVDIHMPEYSGLDLLRYLRRAKRPIPAVVITAFDDAEVRTQCLASGASAFLTKPIQGATLVSAVNAAIALGAHADTEKATGDDGGFNL